MRPSCNAFLSGKSWQYFVAVHPRRGSGQENRPFVARYRRHASKMSWFWQDMLPMYSKCPTKRRWRIHQANILPGRGAFRCTDPLNHAWRATLAMHDGFHRTNLAMFDGSRWTNPVTLDGFTGRIRPCLMAPPGESYRAWWFLSCKSCHPALANPVGQIPLGRVRLMKPTAFTSASAIVISTNALWGKAPE